MKYWEECISEALDEVGIKATSEQIISIAEAVEGGHENYSTAFGYDAIRPTSNGLAISEAELDRESEKTLREVFRYVGGVDLKYAAYAQLKSYLKWLVKTATGK